MAAASPHARRFPIPPWIIRLSVGIACALLGVLVEIGLDQVVAIAPWLVVAFAAGMLAAILGAVLGGVAAAAIGYAVQTVLLPFAFPEVSGIGGVGWPIDLAVAVIALFVGLWIRSLILRPARWTSRWTSDGLTIEADGGSTTAFAPAGGGAGASTMDTPGSARLADRSVAGAKAHMAVARPADSPERELLAAVRDLGTARTPVQVADALARHAVAVSGAGGATVYLRAGDGPGFVARGRFGPDENGAPDRLADRPADRRAGETAHDRPAADPVTRIGQAVLELPFGRGPVPIGIVRLSMTANGSSNGTGPRFGPLIELLCLVAADAIGRGALEGANRSAERNAEVSARRVGTLARLAAALVRSTTVADVSRTLAELAVDDLSAGFAVVHVRDEAGRFRLAHARGSPAGAPARDAVTPEGASGPVTQAALEGTIVEVHGEDGWRTAFPTASNVPAITGVRSISAIPMHASGGLQGVLVIGWRDDDDRVAADRDLLATAADQGAQALERAILHAHDEDARRLQEAFIAVVSHELRTPITTILGGSRLLRRRLEGDAQNAELSGDIEFEADRLSRIVDDLLVLSRLERRHLTLGDEPVHLDHLLTRVVRSEAARWPSHRIEIAAGGASHVVRGDETYIEQVLRNLVSNAAKYSPEGSLVEVAIDETPAEILVRVMDRGAGVAPTEVDELFSLFYRSPTTAASAAGAGIGLFVSRRLVAEMGGRMWASPRPDGGSEFGFALAPYPVDAGDDAGDLATEATAADEASACVSD